MEVQQRDYLLVNQVRILYRQSATTFLFSVFAALALRLFLWDISRREYLLAWTGTVIIYTLLRYIIIRGLRSRTITPGNAGRWLKIFTLGALISGVSRGLAAIVSYPVGPMPWSDSRCTTA